ncbi:MAG: HAD family hydrolase [Treponema sp.]|jgi:HAD superfamily hydrolase (TIGR01549 family)|nr:HAD family hydrolase [Treponema sp.]
MIKNIFLDAGGVILNERNFEENSARIITQVIHRYNKKYLIENYWDDVEEAVYRFIPKVYDYILYKNIGEPDFKKSKDQYKTEIREFNKNFELLDGIKDFLFEFSKRYKIGILGQYGIDFKSYLQEEHLLPYFTYTEIQDDYTITKPDPRYFEMILAACNCKPEESVMIGDRIDKDIIPAKMVGMKTIRIEVGIHKNQKPRIPAEKPDITVHTLKELRVEMLKRMDCRA